MIYFDDTPACLEAAASAGWRGVQVTTADDILKDKEIVQLLGQKT